MTTETIVLSNVQEYGQRVAAEMSSLVAHYIRANPEVPLEDIQIVGGPNLDGRTYTVSVKRKGMPG